MMLQLNVKGYRGEVTRTLCFRIKPFFDEFHQKLQY